ncbi:polysaccharide pyruvyl transferase family protein [Clostridium perfringens]|nr:polysaccharide pyruvyl transferase family protein [Clostridium perfringens]
MKKKVLLFACIEKNMGDDLFISLICNRYPNTKFVISSEAEYGDLKNIDNLEFNNFLKKWIWASEIKGNNFFKKFIGLLLLKYYDIRLGKFDIAVHIVGNAFKNNNYKGWNDSKWIRNRLKKVKEYYLLSTNFGPYNDEQWKKDFEVIYPNLKDICFRDKESYRLFKNLENVRYAPDTVISLGRLEKKMKKEKRIIISTIDCSLPERQGKLENATKTYEELMSKIIDDLYYKGYKITILNSNVEQDEKATKRIINMCKEKDFIEVFNYNGNINEVHELYQQSTAVIATRLHAIILAWLYNIKVVPIVYDVKVSNILNSYGFDNKYYNINLLEKVTTDMLIKDIEAYDYRISDELISKAQDQFYLLDKILKI